MRYLNEAHENLDDVVGKDYQEDFSPKPRKSKL